MSKSISFDDFSNVLDRAASAITGNLENAIKLCGEKIKSDIQYSMTHTERDMSKSYYTSNKKVAHHPSLPGNPPAPDTGNLRASINYEIHATSNEVYGVVGSTQQDPDYAVYTEYGTSKMAPRPWLRPAMYKNNAFVKKSIAKAVASALKGGKE